MHVEYTRTTSSARSSRVFAEDTEIARKPEADPARGTDGEQHALRVSEVLPPKLGALRRVEENGTLTS